MSKGLLQAGAICAHGVLKIQHFPCMKLLRAVKFVQLSNSSSLDSIDLFHFPV
jgi:hypothetical protein